MAYSVRGVARWYRNFVTGEPISIPNDLISQPATGVTLSLRTILRLLAAEERSFPVAECIYGWWAGWQQFWSHVVVRIRLVPDASIAPAALTAAMAVWKNSIETAWSNRFSCVRPGERACPLTFEVDWVTAGWHHSVVVSPGAGNENMGRWFISTAGGTAAHEFGHMLGLPDEYASAICPGRTTVNTGRIMDNNSNNVDIGYFERFARGIQSNLI
jgi:hypothetical protein